MKSTFQSRISEYVGIGRGAGDAALAAYAELYRRVERRLFSDVAAGRSAGSLKSAYLKRYGIPARMFNGVRVSLEGKIASVREQQKLRADGLERRIRKLSFLHHQDTRSSPCQRCFNILKAEATQPFTMLHHYHVHRRVRYHAPQRTTVAVQT